jgi:hypothetical protein
MKPNFQEMTKAELKAYVLEHKDDIEATRHLFRRRTPGQEIKRYPPLSKDGIPIEENIQIMQDAIRQRLEEGNDQR